MDKAADRDKNSIQIPTWVAGIQLFQPSLLPPRVSISRKWESEIEPGQDHSQAFKHGTWGLKQHQEPCSMSTFLDKVFYLEEWTSPCWENLSPQQSCFTLFAVVFHSLWQLDLDHKEAMHWVTRTMLMVRAVCSWTWSGNSRLHLHLAQASTATLLAALFFPQLQCWHRRDSKPSP